MISPKVFAALSEFRFQLARFQRFSVAAARGAGLTQTQYLLLLHIKGYAGRDWATVGELAQRLQASPHGTAALVGRCVALGLVSKVRSREDGRRVEVHLTRRGERLVGRVATLHRNELRSLRKVIRVAHVS